jgi:hypothetical protein
MKGITIAVSAAALLAGTALASAQVYRQDPGSAWQTRAEIEDMAQSSNRHRCRRGYQARGYNAYSAYGAYGAYGGYIVPRAPYQYYRDDPPGSIIQDRGLREELGEAPY